MNKAELVLKVAAKANVTQKVAKVIVDTIFDGMKVQEAIFYVVLCTKREKVAQVTGLSAETVDKVYKATAESLG